MVATHSNQKLIKGYITIAFQTTKTKIERGDRLSNLNMIKFQASFPVDSEIIKTYLLKQLTVFVRKFLFSISLSTFVF